VTSHGFEIHTIQAESNYLALLKVWKGRLHEIREMYAMALPNSA
jgi:hypothetical protein